MNRYKPIDIVIPWVDDQDPQWLAEYRKYKPDRNSDGSDARYRDWDILKYWFRSIEMYAPWVRKIHFVTWGHVPDWLDTDNTKINVVKHSDFIPEKYLPTFSSHTIELNLFRIKDLAEDFVYFNDDVYLTNLTDRKDFFVDGKPVDTAVLGVVKNTDDTNYMPYIMLNMLAVINMEFPKSQVISENRWKWFSPKYGKGMIKNLLFSRWNCFTGFMNYHRCNAFTKSTFEEVWSKYGDVLDHTCSNKFRSKEDVNQYLMRYWQICKGDFVPGKPDSAYVTIGNQPMEEVRSLLYNKKYKIVCINDDPMGFDFEKEKKRLQSIMEEKYPYKSRFEK